MIGRQLGRLFALTLCGLVSSLAAKADPPDAKAPEKFAVQQVREGREVFRGDTFGDEEFWGGQLGLHEAIAADLSPEEALGFGLKVDVKRVPKATRRALRKEKVDLSDPNVTVALLRANAVVGLTGFFDKGGQLTSVGIQCALCHSTVDDSFAPGIGERLDGWANRDLNVGAIVGLAPHLEPIAEVLGVDVATVQA